MEKNKGLRRVQTPHGEGNIIFAFAQEKKRKKLPHFELCWNQYPRCAHFQQVDSMCLDFLNPYFFT